MASADKRPAPDFGHPELDYCCNAECQDDEPANRQCVNQHLIIEAMSIKGTDQNGSRQKCGDARRR